MRTGGVVLIRVVPAVVITVAEPKGFDANVGRVALEMTRRAGGVAFTAIHCFVGGIGVFAIVDAVTDGCHCDTALIGAGELAFSASGVSAAFFIGVIAAVIFVVAFPRFENAAAVTASVLDWTARVKRTVAFVFV